MTYRAKIPCAQRKWLQFFAGLALTNALLLTSTGVNAQEFDRFKFTAGAYDVFRYESTMSLTETGTGVGISFTPEDTLGWKNEQTVLRLDATYRFSAKHGLTASWYELDTTGSRALVKEIDWVDEYGDTITIPVGATVTSGLNMDIYKVAYFWSFYHSDKAELSVGAGLHVSDLLVGLKAELTSSGADASDADSTVPLPVVGFRMNYNVTQKLNWYFQAQLFALQFDNWDGAYSDLQFGAEYHAFEHVGFGLGFGGNTLSLTETSKHNRFEFKNRISGLHAFVAAYF